MKIKESIIFSSWVQWWTFLPWWTVFILPCRTTTTMNVTTHDDDKNYRLNTQELWVVEEFFFIFCASWIQLLRLFIKQKWLSTFWVSSYFWNINEVVHVRGILELLVAKLGPLFLLLVHMLQYTFSSYFSLEKPEHMPGSFGGFLLLLESWETRIVNEFGKL